MCSVCSGTSVTFNLKWLHQIANSDLVLVWLFITKTKTASLLALMMIVFSGWVVSIFLLCFQFVELKKILLRYLPVNTYRVYRKNPQKVIFFCKGPLSLSPSLTDVRESPISFWPFTTNDALVFTFTFGFHFRKLHKPMPYKSQSLCFIREKGL